MKQLLKQALGSDRALQLRRLLRQTRALLQPYDLCNLALLHGSDKWMSHWYAQHYQAHFARFRHCPITLLEIGIGGHDNPRAGGASLRMWKTYFPRGKIYGLDLYDKHALDEARIKTFQGDQSDPAVLQNIIREIGPPDIVIDDGSHINEHVIASFRVLFPALVADGIYAVEDMQTSYWPRYGGNSTELATAPTMMNLFKGLVDGINHEERIQPGYQPTYFDENVVSLHYYHNLVFVQKGRNKEGSIVHRNQPIAGVTEND